MRRHFRRRNPLRAVITADRASRILTAILAVALASAPVAAQTINQNIGGGIGFTFDGGISSKGGGGSGPTCTPGHPTGQMNFSVCSNIAITAALW